MQLGLGSVEPIATRIRGMDAGGPVVVETLVGEAVRSRLDALAALRIAVFRDWPYLYAGDLGYEREYLETYAASPGSVVVLARAGETVVGASTGLPLAQEGATFQAPFLERGIDPERVFYCGESVLLPEYRGRGIGHAFFDAREAHAQVLGGVDWIAFAAVDRDAGDPRTPSGHRGNETFWGKRGYVRQPGMTMRLTWREVGVGDVAHPLTLWLRPLAGAAP